MSSVELAQQLGARQPIAWLIKRELMAAIAAREARSPAGGAGRDRRRLSQQAARRRRARPRAAGKTPFVAAVEDTAEREPRRLRLTVAKGFRKKKIATLASATSPPAAAWSATACPAGRQSASRLRPLPHVTSSGRTRPVGALHLGQRRARRHRDGARRPSHHVNAKHAQRYLTSFAWRFNRRASSIPSATSGLRLARTAPHPYQVIIAG